MRPIRDQRSSSCTSTLPVNNNKKITRRRQTSVADESAYWRRTEQRQDNLKLCALVKEAPCLYDTNHTSYGNKEAADSAWKVIADKCGQTESCCKKRFRNLRVAYAVAIGAYKTDKGANIVKPYYLHKHLDFLKPFFCNERGRKVPKGQQRTIIEISSDETDDDATPALENENQMEDDDKFSDVGSTASTEINTNRKRAANRLNENINAKQRLMSTSTTLEDAAEIVPEDTTEIVPEDASEFAAEDTTKLEPNNNAQHDIIILEDKNFLSCILSVMQDMNKRQKHIFKAKIWESVHTVLDSNADYPSVSNTCSEAHAARHNKNHSDSETVMLGIASLNECELREIHERIQRREQEIASRDHFMVQIPGNNVNIICNNNEPNTSARQTPLLSSPICVKQEPTSTDTGI